MPATELKVELELYAVNVNNTLFILDDPVEGVLDDPDNTLSGFVFVDVTNYVQAVNIQRGKSRLLDRYESGTASIVFNNSTRAFDPKYAASPFFGAIYPRLNIRISANGMIQYTGVIQDWNIEYDPAGPSFASASCSDRFTNLTQSILPNDYQELQLSGARVNAILDLPEVNWPSDARLIGTGQSLLQEDLIPENTDALSYLQLIETSEQGQLFIAKDGKLVFHERNYAPAFDSTFADDGTGIPYAEINVVYGTELLFNRIEANALGDVKSVASDPVSENAYGISTLNLTDLLNESPTEVESMTDYLLSIYKEPEYRFDTLRIALHKLSREEQDEVLGIELSDIIYVKFTPSNLPPAIDEYSTVIKIDHEVGVAEHFITFSLGSTGANALILDSPALGVLDVATLLF
jgi:hypothetical protein